MKMVYDAFSDPAESIFSASQQGPLNVRRLNQPSASDILIIIMTLILRKIEIMWWIPKKKKKWRCLCDSSGACQTLVIKTVGSNPAWSLAQQASYLQKKAKLTKAATFSIVQVFLRVAEHRGKIHASQPASLDFILGVPFTHLLSGIAN